VIRSSFRAGQGVVDDLTQEVYVHLWGQDFHVLRQWQCESPLRAYLRTVIVRLVWERLNRLQPAREQLVDDPLVEAGARHGLSEIPATPEQLACAHELMRVARSALNDLNDNDRYVLELRYFRELSYREIADVLGITPNGAGVRLTRALGRLKLALRQRIDDTQAFGFEELSFAGRLVVSL
jgi:RNA polymerase sigma factor (sigma-70 family)